MKLASLVIEFVSKGFEGVQAALKNLSGQSETLAATITRAGNAAKASMTSMRSLTDGMATGLGPALIGRIGGISKQIDLLSKGMGSFGKVAEAAGGAAAARFAIFKDMMKQAVAERVAPAAQAATTALVGQLAAVKGLSAGQAQRLRSMVELHVGLGEFKKKLDATAAGMASFGRAAAVGFAAATAAIGGFITAGMRGTAVGDYLSFRMGELSRNIAGMVRPEIEKVVGWIEKATMWFRSLSDEQAENIVKWIEASLVALAVAMIMPKVVAGISALIGVVQLLTGAQLSLNAAAAATGTWIALVVSAIAYLVVGTEAGRSALGKLTDALGSLNFEAVSAFFKWTAFGVAMAGVILIVPKVIAAIRTLITALRALRTAEILAMAVTPAGLAMMVAGLAVAAGTIAALAIIEGGDDEEADKAKGKKSGRRAELLPSSSGIEAVTAAWDRIAKQSSSLGMMTTEEQILDENKKQTERLENIDRTLGDQRPAFVGAR